MRVPTWRNDSSPTRYSLHLATTDGTRTAVSDFDLQGADELLPRMISQCSASPSTFSDVSDSHPQASDIAYSASQGWFEGYADGTYRPDTVISASQIRTVVNRAVPQGSTRGGHGHIPTCR